MSDAISTPSAEQTASPDARLAESETNLATNPSNTGDSTSQKPATYTDMASNATSTAASSAHSAATGVKDSVFSMFGGGAKKETKVEDDDAANDRSGSAKAQKEKEDDEVGYKASRLQTAWNEGINKCRSIANNHFYYRRTRPTKKKQMSSSSPSYTLRRPSRPRQTRRLRSRRSRCELSSSSSTERAESGRSEALVMFDYSSTRRMARLGWSCEGTRLSRSAQTTTVRSVLDLVQRRSPTLK
jgi:hypothetical protein